MDQPQQAGVARINKPQTYEMRGEMGLSLSFHPGDFHGARILLDTIELLEPMKHVDVVLSIMGGPEALDDREWYDFQQKALEIFRRVYLNNVRVVVAQDTADGRDYRPNNMMFRSVADYFNTLAFHKKKEGGIVMDDYRRPYIGAFYYLEPDCAILQKDWFSQLTAEYVMSRKPFMGVVRNTGRRLKDNRALPAHVNGSMIYPNPLAGPEGLTNYGGAGKALLLCAANQLDEAYPWDLAAGPSVVPQTKNTKLIYVEFGNGVSIPPAAVIWHGDKQYQHNLATIENITGISPERPHLQNDLSSDLMQMPGRIQTRPLEDEQPSLQEALTGLPSTRASLNPEEFVQKVASQPDFPKQSAASIRATAERMLARAAQVEAEEKAAAQLAKHKADEAHAIATNSQDYLGPIQPTVEPQKPRKPEQIYREALAEAGHDPLALARAIKWAKAQQKKAKAGARVA